MAIPHPCVGVALFLGLGGLVLGGTQDVQEVGNPVSLLVSFVKKDVRRVMPREIESYELGPIFLSMAEESQRVTAPELFDEGVLAPLGVAPAPPGTPFRRGERGNYVRDFGVYIGVRSIERGEQGIEADTLPRETLSIDFVYFVTFPWPDGRTEICAMSWKLLLVRPKATREAREGWQIHQAMRKGVC